MSIVSDFQALPGNSLRPSERAMLVPLIDNLRLFLGAPGDWGYDTKLGELARIIRVQADALEENDSASGN